MTRVDRWITEYVERVIADIGRSNYSGINVVERILKDPGIATGQGSHRVLWWPHRKKRISKAAHRRASWTSKAFHQLTPVEAVILIVHYGHVPKGDGSRFTKADLCANSSLTQERYLLIKKTASKKMSRILSSYHRNGADGEKKKLA